MNEFWIAIGFSLVLASIYVWFSIQRQRAQNQKVLNLANTEQNIEVKSSGNKSTIWIVLPILLLFCSPLVYLSLGSQEKQIQLTNAQHLISKITSQNPAISSNVLENSAQIPLEDLVLSLRAACADQPENGELWFTLAETYFQLRMVDLADAAISRAVRLEARPNWLVANAQILSLRSNDSDIAKSIRLLRKAIQIQPGHQSALLTLGFIYLRQQQFQLAINIWQQLKSILSEEGNNTDMLIRQIEFAQKQLKNPP